MRRSRGARTHVVAGRRRALLAALLLFVPAAAWSASSAAAAARAGSLEIFSHPLHGGEWTSHHLHGIGAVGGTAPAIAATSDGTLVVAQRAQSGDVVVATGPASGAMSPVDLTASVGAPAGAGRLQVTVSPANAITVWYRSATGDLIVATEPALGQPWSVLDVMSSTGGAALVGDPTVATIRGVTVAFGVVVGGTLAEFVPPLSATGAWAQLDPTRGLAYPALVGSVAVVAPVSDPNATVLVGTASYGDLLELSNQLRGPIPAVGPWHSTDLSALGAPAAYGPIASAATPAPLVSFISSYGDLIEVTFGSGLPDGFVVTDLTLNADASPAAGAVPVVIAAPFGPTVEFRTSLGDVQLVAPTPLSRAMDVSYLRGTEELVSSDAAATRVGASEVLVAADGGPIAPTPLQRRILVTATQWDQQHALLQTTPAGSDCNPFTAAWGRGSTYGCKPGTAAEAWCSDFAQWVWQTSGVPTGGISGWSASFVTWGVAHHRVQFGTHFTAKPGDAIVWGTRSPLYGTHVAIVLAVSGRYIDVENGNDGGDLPGYQEGVWRSGPFIGSTSTVSGYPVLAVVSP